MKHSVDLLFFMVTLYTYNIQKHYETIMLLYYIIISKILFSKLE